MSDLHQMRVAIIAVDGFEESELTEPKKALEKAGATADVLSEKKGMIQGFKHHDKAGKVKVDRALDEIHIDEYEAILLPGGALNADYARALPRVRQIIFEMDRARTPIAGQASKRIPSIPSGYSCLTLQDRKKPSHTIDVFLNHDAGSARIVGVNRHW